MSTIGRQLELLVSLRDANVITEAQWKARRREIDQQIISELTSGTAFAANNTQADTVIQKEREVA